jgi:hypothetical protein
MDKYPTTGLRNNTMLDSFANSRQCLQELVSICKFDLVNGPYITGSFLTYHLEDNPTWIPNDIDIVCRTESQFKEMVDKFKNIGFDREKDEILFFSKRLFKQQNEIQIILYNITAEDYVKWADLTLCCMCSDGVTQIMSATTLNDIQNKLMVENNGNFLLNLNDPKFNFNRLRRYQKYIDRGYRDINNVIYNKLINETRTN